jgi:predicted Zn-dependent peptidase
VVCIAGNIEQSIAEKKAAKYFGGVDVGTPVKKQEVNDTQQKPELLLEYRKINQTNIALGVRGYNVEHPDRYAQHILSVILGGMMSSRLFVEIREKLGLAYDISTSADTNADTGYLVTTAGIKKGYAPKAIQVILREYKKLKTTQISKTELAKVKENEKGKMALRLESSDSKANFYGMQELLRGEILTQEQIYDKIEQVTVADIQRVAKDLFLPEKLNLVVLGPYRDKTEFVKLLKL